MLKLDCSRFGLLAVLVAAGLGALMLWTASSFSEPYMSVFLILSVSGCVVLAGALIVSRNAKRAQPEGYRANEPNNPEVTALVNSPMKECREFLSLVLGIV